MQPYDDSSFQEHINNLSWRDRAELFHQLSPLFFRAVCDMFIPGPDDRSDEQLISEYVEAFVTCPHDFLERARKFFAIWDSMQVQVSSHTPSLIKYTRFADVISDLLADERPPSKVYNILTQAIIEIGNLTGQSAEAFAQQTRLWLPAALEELEEE